MAEEAQKIATLSDAEKVAKEFLRRRKELMVDLDVASRKWNDAVASLVEKVGSKISNYASTHYGKGWHRKVAKALRDLEEPLKSDVILSNSRPNLKNDYVDGSCRVFGSCFLEGDLEFMPKEFEYPKFPYFQVEPARLQTLSKAGLVLLANPPGIEAEEPNRTDAIISMETYTKSPMISVDLKMQELGSKRGAALLLNWSCKGREGAMAKIFINGRQDVPAIEVMSSDDDPTPNFWTFVPWKSGTTVVDLKMVGDGYLWFEHVDVHSVFWMVGD